MFEYIYTNSKFNIAIKIFLIRCETPSWLVKVRVDPNFCTYICIYVYIYICRCICICICIYTKICLSYSLDGCKGISPYCLLFLLVLFVFVCICVYLLYVPIKVTIIKIICSKVIFLVVWLACCFCQFIFDLLMAGP